MYDESKTVESIQFGYLDQMQDELGANYPGLDIQILGVNEAGYQSGNGSITAWRDIPWLQDIYNHDGRSDVWKSWDVAYRDVVIVDAGNVKVGTFNVTAYDLRVAHNYDTLRQMLVNAAVPEPPSLTLLAVAAAGLLAYQYRRRKTRSVHLPAI